MKKTGILLATALMLCPIGANAAVMEINQQNSVITVTVDIERNEKSVSVLVKGIDSNGGIVYLDDSYTDSDGLYSGQFNAENAEGIITVTAKIKDEGAVQKEILVRTAAIEKQIVETLTKEDTTAGEIRNVVDNYWHGLDLDERVFNELTDSSGVYEILATDSQNKDVKDFEGFMNAFYRAVIIQKYNELENKNNICTYMEKKPYSSFASSSYSDCYKIVNSAIKGKIGLDMESKYSDSEQFFGDLEFSVLKNSIRYAVLSDDLSPVLEKYKDKIGISGKITTSLCRKVIGKTYSSYSEIKKALEESGSSGSGGSGGGGSSSSSGSSGSGLSVIVTPTNPPAQSIQDNTQKKGAEAIFTDMEMHKWADNAVRYAYENGIIAGYGDGKFCPSREITRAEMVKMFVAYMNADLSRVPETLPFEDVSADSWSYKYIAYAYTNGIIDGMSENYFGADLPITRQDMAIIAWKIMKKMGASEGTRKTDFSDSDEISSWAKDAVEILGGNGIIHGRTTDNGIIFDPKATVIRVEAAVIIHNIAKSMM